MKKSSVGDQVTEIVALKSDDTTEFIKFPWRVYAGDHLWTPPLIRERKAFLDPRKNPFFQHAEVQTISCPQGRQDGRTDRGID